MYERKHPTRVVGATPLAVLFFRFGGRMHTPFEERA